MINYIIEIKQDKFIQNYVIISYLIYSKLLHIHPCEIYLLPTISVQHGFNILDVYIFIFKFRSHSFVFKMFMWSLRAK